MTWKAVSVEVWEGKVARKFNMEEVERDKVMIMKVEEEVEVKGPAVVMEVKEAAVV